MQHANRVDFYVNMAFKLRFLCSAKLPKLYKNIENIIYIVTEIKRGKGEWNSRNNNFKPKEQCGKILAWQPSCTNN